MKKILIVSLTVLLSPICLAGEWYVVGSGQTETKVNTEALEIKLWEFLAIKSKVQFRDKKIYRFQYKFVGTDEIYINALCRSTSPANDIGVIPDFTIEQLTKDFITVYDGGSCFFGVKFNTKKEKFSKLHINGLA